MSATNEAVDFLAANGMRVPGNVVVTDGKIRRFKVGDSKRANGWAWFVERGEKIIGRVGDWKTGRVISVGSARDFKRITSERSVVQYENSVFAAEIAREQWHHLALDGYSAYLRHKHVLPYGVRFGRGRIAVPMVRDGEIVSLEWIYDNGTKRFTKGSSWLGAYHVLRDLGEVAICVAEGYATAASIHMAMAVSTVVAFTAGNLLPVVRSLRAEKPRSLIVLCADNDIETPGNPGLTKAREAAEEVDRVHVAFPPTGGDFNDLHIAHGLAAVGNTIYKML